MGVSAFGFFQAGVRMVNFMERAASGIFEYMVAI